MTRFIPPRQHRSQETLHRILDAAEQVLAHKSFNEATLAEIVERAGVTVGAFYRRFPDKDALLHHLDERFFDELYSAADAVFDPARWEGARAGEIVEAAARAAVGLYRERRGLLRSLFLRARTDPVIQANARRVNAHHIECLRAILLARRAELGHPDPELAVALGFRMFVGILRETVLFDDVWPPESASGDRLATEVGRALRCYLGIAEPPPLAGLAARGSANGASADGTGDDGVGSLRGLRQR
jgi:AcrR family transcriptional regulator